MRGVSRRVVGTLVAAATVLLLMTSAVSAADPDSTRPSAALGARGHASDHARVQLQHGGGLKPPATDIEVAVPLFSASPSSGMGAVDVTWVLVFAGGALASLRYMTRRARL
jgi:hypothetical protein